MKTKSIDHLVFEGKEAVLNRVDQMPITWLDRLKALLNHEVEIPVTALALSCLLFISVLSFKERKSDVEFYPIVIIEAGGHYEVY